MKRLKVDTLTGSPVTVWYCEEFAEYQVRVAGKPKATYHTDDRADALRTAQVMRNTQGAK